MTPDTYHHGNLKEELIQKGLRLLAREGYEGLSMRKLARLCNVSHAAPYKHFADKEALVFAISNMIETEFSAALKDACAKRPEDLRGQIVELGKAYVEFLTKNPDFFRFVFTIDHGHPYELGAFTRDTHPMAVAYAASMRYYERYETGFNSPVPFFMGIWSLIHGFTLLLVNHTVKIEGDPLQTAGEMLERFLTGLNAG